MSIIIPYFRGAAFIFRCVDSIINGKGLENVELKVIIVHNCPERNKPLRFVDERVHVVHCRKSIGYGSACNVGLKIAQQEERDLFLFCNQDVVFEPNCISQLIELATENLATPEVLLPINLQYDSLQLDSTFTNWTLMHHPEIISDWYHSIRKKTYIIGPQAPGACFLLKKNLASGHPLFDPLFKMYFEEYDLFRRIQDSGGCIKLAVTACIHHHNSNINQEDNRAIVNWKFESYFTSLLKEGKYHKIFTELVHHFVNSLIRFRIRTIIALTIIVVKLPFISLQLRKPLSQRILHQIIFDLETDH